MSSKLKAAKSRYSLACFWGIESRHTSDTDRFSARLVLLDAESNKNDETPYGGIDPVSWAFDLPRVKDLDGLEFMAYIDRGGEKRGRAWAVKAEFDVKVSDVHVAERILRVLKRFDAAGCKLNDARGYPKDLAEHFGRFCEIAGVEFILRACPNGPRWASGYQYATQTVGEAVNEIRNKLAADYGVEVDSPSLALVS